MLRAAIKLKQKKKHKIISNKVIYLLYHFYAQLKSSKTATRYTFIYMYRTDCGFVQINFVAILNNNVK